MFSDLEWLLLYVYQSILPVLTANAKESERGTDVLKLMSYCDKICFCNTFDRLGNVSL